MKKLLIPLLLLPIIGNAQSWTRIHTPGDSLWASSIKAFNLGDTIIYKGKTDAEEYTTKWFVSTNAGLSFQADTTPLKSEIVGASPIYALPHNKMIIGFKSAPAPTGHKFMGVNNWPQLYASWPMVFGEAANGDLIMRRTTNYEWFTMTPQGTNMTTLPTVNFGMQTSIVRNGRLIIGGSNGDIYYVDNNDFNNIQEATMPIDVPANGRLFRKFFVAGNALYGICYIAGDVLLKSTDNGTTWTKIVTTFVKNGQTNNLKSSSTIGTPNGKIYFVDGENSTNNVLVSNDGGVTASSINTGLPSPAGSWQELFASGNTVYYNYRVINTTDFVRVDTSISGIYRLAGTTAIKQIKLAEDLVEIYPNPAKDLLNISTKIKLETYRIFTMTGGEIASGNCNGSTIDISKIANGFYLLQLANGEGMVLKSFIKK